MYRRLPVAVALSALAVAVTLIVPLVPARPAAAATCGTYSSESAPPPTIRVFRTGSGAVETVDFRAYVKNVLSREWISSWTTESLRSGAVAVKSYAWYQVLHWRGYVNEAGECFDIFDSTRDQHYDPSKPTYASMAAAVDATWTTVALQERPDLPDLLQRRRGERSMRRERQRLADVPVGNAGLRACRPQRRPDPRHLLRRRDGRLGSGARPATADPRSHACSDTRADAHRDAVARSDSATHASCRPPHRLRPRPLPASPPAADRSGSALRRPRPRPIPNRSWSPPRASRAYGHPSPVRHRPSPARASARAGSATSTSGTGRGGRGTAGPGRAVEPRRRRRRRRAAPIGSASGRCSTRWSEDLLERWSAVAFGGGQQGGGDELRGGDVLDGHPDRLEDGDRVGGATVGPVPADRPDLDQPFLVDQP